MDRALATTVALWLCVTYSWAQSQEMTLAELLSALEKQGISVLYSSALVNPGHMVAVDSIGLTALVEALEPLGLSLEANRDVWVIVRAQPPQSSASDTAVTDDSPPLESVIVTGSMHSLPYIGASASAHSFTPEDLALVPTLGSDALRATLRLPGVSSLGVSAKPRIRGGLQDELLVMQDGVELLEPFHLADYHSAYSSIDYHTIETLDIYTGGFPSRYGYRMSGVMDISNQWREDRYNTDIGLSSFSNFIHTRGQLSRPLPSEWLLSFRQGDLTDLADYIDTRSGDPKYKDASARINMALTDTLSVSSGVAYASDDIQFEDEEELASSQIDTWYVWLNSEWMPAKRVASRLTVSWLDFDREKQQASFELDEEDPGKGGFLDHRQQVERIALRNDWFAATGWGQWESGWQLEYNKASYAHRSRIDRGELAEILGTEAEVDRDIRESPSGWSGGTYVQLEWDINERFILQPSMRFDFQDYYLASSTETQFSPRLGIAYRWNDQTTLRLSAGRFHQQEGIHELQIIDGISRFFPPQYSDQAIFSIEWKKAYLELLAELYLKHYSDQKARFENIFNPFVLLPEMEPDRVGIWPERAKARGIDLEGRFSPDGPLEGYLRYSYMDARDRIDNTWVDRRWSQRHTVNTGIVWQADSFSISLAFTWHSGWRSTEMPGFVPEDSVVPVASVLNNTELSDYYSLDLGLRKHWEFSRSRLEIYADLVNLTDHKNLAGIDYDIEEVDGGFELTPDYETLLGRVPSVGITLSF